MKQHLSEMLQMPLLGSNVFAITGQASKILFEQSLSYEKGSKRELNALKTSEKEAKPLEMA